ncbi:MAG: CHAT domain-containing protein [Acidobacteriota bacterium]|nr:CHAT domain-containing protein [Acidobacteriota bacterium]MDQ5835248.1 CHAT domain-containing protein [Acidobacteriota bacterium]
MEQSNVLLVFMCLDLRDPISPLRSRSGTQGQTARFLEDEDNRYQLLVAVLDPAQRGTSAPVTGIEMNKAKRRTYNSILRQFQRISASFYDDGGYIDRPDSYTEERQEEVDKAISIVGCDIYDLFLNEAGRPNPIRDRLDRLLGPSDAGVRQRSTKSVTILSNDFGIPWFWMKRERHSPFLCEVCSLGLLQLTAVGRATEPQQAPPGQKDKTYEALLIKGSTNLPFQDEELNMITSLLGDPDRGAARTFNAQLANTPNDILNLLQQDPAKLIDDFRIVHFSGHYTGRELLLSGQRLPVRRLEDFLSGALLVLDGCSSARNLDAWADVEGLTSMLINEGTLGCVVTVLPVKHDPIVSKILWGAFYRELRRGSSTVGQALTTARCALRDHFEKLGSRNPAWAVYQLIGSPAVQLCDEEGELDG